MLRNYIKVAIRNIARNKLYAVINIIGLAMGLTLYIFGGLFYDYEYSHDLFFEKSDQIYTVGSNFRSPEEHGGPTTNVVYTGLTPFIKAELSEIEDVSRTFNRSYLLSTGVDSYYQSVRFSDPNLLDMFEFDYIYGDKTALANSRGAVITETIANKYFEDGNAMGKTISINREFDLIVTAVIRELPLNTHFNSDFTLNRPLEILVPLNMIELLEGRAADENWNELSNGNLTYILLPETLGQNWLQSQMDGIYDRHYPDNRKRIIESLTVRTLASVNASIWEEIGIPAIEILRILGISILIIACLNYTNLATAQSLGRTREVGLRKTLGAGPVQLLTQFIVESLTLTFIAMIVALSLLEVILPTVNIFANKSLSLNFSETLPWLIITVVAVGTLSGTYPAYVITKTNPIQALRDNARKGKTSSLVRGIMISAQFSISVFMLALVLVVYSQNNMVEESRNIFPNDQIYTLDRLGIEEIEGRHEILKNEIFNISGVENFSYSSQVPYEGFRNGFVASTILNDISSGFRINQMVADHQFLDTYNIQLVAGRKTSNEIALDTQITSRDDVNALINEMAARNLGFESAEAAIGNVFYEQNSDGSVTTYSIVGVIEDQNIYGLQNEIVPFVYFNRASSYRHASIKLSTSATQQTIDEIGAAWKRINPEYPLQARFLDQRFQERFRVFDLSTKSLASFTLFALFLALIGLFGLAAFMAEQRTKEIGIRKVLGANSGQIVKLLIWQFSKPVLWAMPLALVLAYFVSNLYLEYFPDRISMPFGILVGAGIIGLLLAWATVATHAYKVSRTNPVNALHYE